MIPSKIKIKKDLLPDQPGVYFYFDEKGHLLYIGKATSLKRRVSSYFNKAHDRRIAEMVGQIAKIDYIETPTVIEALVLEANQIKAKKPKYNILQRDDKSFLYLVVTNEDFPKPVLMRGHELKRLGIDPFKPKLTEKAKKKFLRVFGPYTSSRSLKLAMDLIRKIIPWSDCEPPSTKSSPLIKGGIEGGQSTNGVQVKSRPCFNAHIGKCPGVCTGKINKQEYRRIIRQFILFFEGKRKPLLREMKKEMTRAAKEHRYEDAAKYRNRIYALEHIQDVAVIGRDDVNLPYDRSQQEGTIDLMGRIEAYDISNISGTSAVGSMVVFEEGQPAKDKYRKFKIKTVKGINDVAMLEEMLRRRLKRNLRYPDAWPLPEIMVIDGGKGQINRVRRVLTDLGLNVPLIGLAKGFDRKQDRLVYDRADREVQRVAHRGKEIFQRARDEAHRFAVKYHRNLRSKASIGKKR